MKRWFLSQQGNLKGPFTLAQLTAMIPAGSLKPEDMLRPEDGGSPTWARRVPGLFSPGEPEPAPAPAPVQPAPVQPAPSVAVTAKPAAAPVVAFVASQPSVSPAPSPIQPPVSAAPQPPPAGQSNLPLLIGAGVVAGLLLICVLPVAGLGLMWIFSGNEKKSDAKAATQVLAVKQQQEEPPIEKPKPKPPPMSPQVKAAVDKGVEFLRPQIEGQAARHFKNKGFVNDHEVGSTALAGLALLEADVPLDDPSVQKVLSVVRDAGPRVNLAYSLGTMLFFLNRLDDMQRLSDADRALARSMALRLLAGQMSNGFWAYQNPPITPQAEDNLLERLAKDGYKPQRPGGSNDPSTTQFALLALWGSRRYDLPIDPAIFAAASHFHQTQSAQGTWGYSGGIVWKDSNTCAGLIALAMEKTMREDKKFQRGGSAKPPPAHPNSDEQIAKAFAHLKQAIERNTKKMPGQKGPLGARLVQADSHGDYYFLWSLERVAVIYDLKEIGGNDWFAWGSELLVKHQTQNGSWAETHGAVNDTCFAILFLTRANLAKDLTESIRTRGGKAAIP